MPFARSRLSEYAFQYELTTGHVTLMVRPEKLLPIVRHLAPFDANTVFLERQHGISRHGLRAAAQSTRIQIDSSRPFKKMSVVVVAVSIAVAGCSA